MIVNIYDLFIHYRTFKLLPKLRSLIVVNYLSVIEQHLPKFVNRTISFKAIWCQ